MAWPASIFQSLVEHYPRGNRDAVVSAWRFRDTRLRSPSSCALRLSDALRQAVPNSMASFTGSTWTTAEGASLARSSTRLAEYIRDESGWDARFESRGDGQTPLRGYWSPDGQGIMFWRGRVASKYHIDLWDSQRHLDAAMGRCMLWRPAPGDTIEQWFWRLEPPTAMIFGFHDVGLGGTFL